MSFTKVPKPSATTYTGVNPIGKQTYNDSSITYADPTVYYNGINVNQWTDVACPYDPTALLQSLIAYYKLNENATNTNVVDATGIQATATASRNTNLLHATGGFLFNGTTDFVNVPHNADQLLTSGFAIAAWITPLTLGESNGGRILDKSAANAAQGGFTFLVDVNNTLTVRINNFASIRSANGSITLGTRQFVGVSVEADGTATLYVNSAPSGTPGVAGACSGITTTNAMRIGNRSGATDRTFNGTIGDLALFNLPQDSTAFTFLFNGGVPLEYPFSYWTSISKPS